MATGLTAQIPNGLTFPEFALRCARQFGPTIRQRDDDTDVPPKLPKNDAERHKREAAEYLQRQQEMLNMGDQQKIDWGKTEKERELNYLYEAYEKRRQDAIAYVLMYMQAMEWQPPSPRHQKLKDFMLTQISETIDWDCDLNGLIRRIKLVESEQPMTFFEVKIKDLSWSYQFHIEQAEKQQVGHESNCTWIIQLYQSLGLPVPAEDN